MLRIFVLALVLTNLGFYLWSKGSSDAPGEREPARLEQQVSPQLIKVLGAQAAAPKTAQAKIPPTSTTSTTTTNSTTNSTLCLELGPISTNQLANVQALVHTALPAERWRNLKTETPAQWMVAMLPSSDSKLQAKQISTLENLGASFEVVNDVPKLGNVLSLGVFNNRLDADKAAARLAQRSVRRLSVALYAGPLVTHTLRAERIDATTQEQLKQLQGSSVLAGGRGFRSCDVP
jgi:hypothetical protein